MQISIRKLTENDCYDIWVWRNHPQVRKWCFNTEAIGYDAQHKKWFKTKFNNEGVRMYIAEIENTKKIGQIRFDKDIDTRWYVNVNLNPQFFGQSLGDKVIRLATEYFLNEEDNAKEVIAQVKKENRTSLKAFGKAGFVCLDKLESNKENIKIFTYKRRT